MTRFLDLAALDDAQIAGLLRRARELQQAPLSDALRGKVLALLFMNPSLRTLASFQAGMAQLGGSSFVIAPGAGSWALETQPGVVMDGDKPEHVRDAIPVLAGYADALGVRAFATQKDVCEDLEEVFLRELNAITPGPLINLESAANHPCQALAEWKSLDDLEVPHDGRFVLSWTWHPKALAYAVPAATATMAARRGMDLVILRPEGYDLPDLIMDRIYREASRSGGRVTITDDREAAMQGAHVLYAKSWARADAPGGYGAPEAHLRHWCADETWYGPARAEAKFFHCLPLRRNVEATDALLDGPRSEVQRVANNRLHVQKAILMEMLT